MKVELLKPYGFCSGASKAIELVKKVRKDNPYSRIILFGPIVHNENVDELMKKLDINVLDLPYDEYFNVIDTLKVDDIVILPAHGHDLTLENKLMNKGILYVDATCPIIQKIHNLILNEYRDKDIIYIGKNNHIESITTCLLKDNIYLYDLNKGINNDKYYINEPIILYQTTLTKNDVKVALKSLKKQYPNNIVSKSHCKVCQNRQNALINSIKDDSFVIVVGSKTSSNSLSLLNICKERMNNNHYLIVNSLDEIKEIELDKNLTYIITSGTSTPNSLVESIYKYLRDID